MVKEMILCVLLIIYYLRSAFIVPLEDGMEVGAALEVLEANAHWKLEALKALESIGSEL